MRARAERGTTLSGAAGPRGRTHARRVSVPGGDNASYCTMQVLEVIAARTTAYYNMSPMQVSEIITNLLLHGEA